VILRFLAQESPNSELLLKRYEGKKFEGQKYEFWKVIGASLENCRGSCGKDLQFGARDGVYL
jgi:hypothetical protein